MGSQNGLNGLNGWLSGNGQGNAQQSQAALGQAQQNIYVQQGSQLGAGGAGGVLTYSGQHPQQAPWSQEQIDEAKNNVIKRFLECPVEQREAYLITLRAYVVAEHLAVPAYSNAYFSVNRVPNLFGVFKDEKELLRHLEEAHTTECFEITVLDANINNTP